MPSLQRHYLFDLYLTSTPVKGKSMDGMQVLNLQNAISVRIVDQQTKHTDLEVCQHVSIT